MRKIITLLVFAIFLTSVVSADILIQQQPETSYNLGEVVSIPVKVIENSAASGTLNTELLCEGSSRSISQGLIWLNSENSYQETKTLIIPLEREFIGELNGECEVRISFKNEIILTSKFTISNLINIDFPMDKVEFKPGENIIVKGKATKNNGKSANGVIELSVINDVKDINVMDSVKDGYFSINFSIPKDMPAGQYLTKVKVYEKDSEGQITNNGFVDYNILVVQVPTNLEIVFENKEVEPGTNLKVKTILHDQTGEPIESNSIITIKNANNKILEQAEKPTNEFLEYPVVYNQPPENWTVFAVSTQLTSESNFHIKEKKDVKAELINKTLIVTNVGNVPYNDTLVIKIGEQFVSLNITLGVDESEKFVMSAPDGQYEIEVTTAQGENKISGNAILTGDSIDVRKAAEGVANFARHPIVWIFIVAILGFMAFIVYRKGYQKSFIGYIKTKYKKKDTFQQLTGKKKEETTPFNSKNKAELSLSIKGEKQNVSLVCVHIKNMKDIEDSKNGAKETLQKIISTADEDKASLYENQDNLFFIFSSITTRTFKNEKTALRLAQKINETLTEHNKLAKQKIEFGISLNYGTIVGKREKDVLKFMSMGTLITGAKKIASIADKEILLGEKIKEKLMTDVKTEKQIRNNVAVYSIKNVRKEPEEKSKKFLNEFVKRMDKGGKNLFE
ncbi:MAG: hypothetical protein Q8P15_01680 [Nanoarchaeota archaeon]|nr:hypothetical protein [Nanoarchaeota archaeon]